MMHCGTEMKFEIKRSEGSLWTKTCWKWKEHFQDLLTGCVDKYQTDFHQSYTSDEMRDEWHQKVRVQDHAEITYKVLETALYGQMHITILPIRLPCGYLS